MQGKILLYDLNEFGENYSKMTPIERQRYIKETIIGDLLDSKNITETLAQANKEIELNWLDNSLCPECGEPLTRQVIDYERFEA
jgi:hypothetical protein